MKRVPLLVVMTSLFLINISINAQTIQDYYFVIKSLKSISKKYNPALAKKIKVKYPLAEQYVKYSLQDAKKSKGQFPNEKIYYAYLKLKKLDFAVNQAQKLELKKPKYSSKKFEKYRIRAAEEHYLVGGKWLQKKDRESAKQALYHFKKTEKLKKNFRDTPQKMRKAWNLASYQVLIKTDFSPLESQKLNVADFEYNLQQYFENQSFGQPIQFLLAKEVKLKNGKKPDHVLTLKFNYFSVGQTYLKAEKEQINKNTAYFNYKKRVKARGSFIVKITEYNSDKEFVNQPLTEVYTWISEWGKCEGNKASLSKVQQRFCKISEPERPSEKVLFEEFCRVAYHKITANISDFYTEEKQVN